MNTSIKKYLTLFIVGLIIIPLSIFLKLEFQNQFIFIFTYIGIFIEVVAIYLLLREFYRRN